MSDLIPIWLQIYFVDDWLVIDAFDLSSLLKFVSLILYTSIKYVPNKSEFPWITVKFVQVVTQPAWYVGSNKSSVVQPPRPKGLPKGRKIVLIFRFFSNACYVEMEEELHSDRHIINFHSILRGSSVGLFVSFWYVFLICLQLRSKNNSIYASLFFLCAFLLSNQMDDKYLHSKKVYTN